MLETSKIWLTFLISAAFFVACSKADDDSFEMSITQMPATTLEQTDCSLAKVSEQDVVANIFKNYSKQSRPRIDSSETVKVSVGISLFGIKQFVERENLLILNGYISLLWQDDFLKYDDKFPLRCIDYMYVDADQMWTPNLSFMSGFLEKDPSLYPAKGTKVSVANDGSMELYPMGEIQVKCELDLSLFPFDDQVCTIILESWSYPKQMQALELFEPENTSALARVENMWIENEQWDIVENLSAIVHPIYFPNNSQIFDRALFILKLERKSLFYRMHIVLPSLIIASVEIVTFILPIHEVVKLEISFTCLLAYMVFQDSAMSEMPRSSKSVPFLSIFITLQMAYIGLIAITGEGIVFILLRQATFRKSPPPLWAYQTAKRIGSVVFFECQVPRPKSRRKNVTMVAPYSEESGGVDEINLERNVSSLGLTQRHKSASQQASTAAAHKHDPQVILDACEDMLSAREQWTYIAEVVERCNMLLYAMAVIITPCVMFQITPRKKNLADYVRRQT